MNVKKESLRDKILEYLSNNPSSEVKDIATYVKISKQALYYHIKLLTKQKKIQIVDSQFVNGIEKKFYSLNAAQDPDNTDNQAVLVDDDSSTSSTNTKQKKSPLPQSIDDNTQKTSDLDLDKEWRAISLTNIKQFAEMLNANTGIVFEVSRQVENMIVSKINTNLVTAQEELIDAKKDGLDYLSDDMKGESSIIEPPFIVAIKEILERVSKREINLLSKKN